MQLVYPLRPSPQTPPKSSCATTLTYGQRFTNPPFPPVDGFSELDPPRPRVTSAPALQCADSFPAHLPPSYPHVPSISRDNQSSVFRPSYSIPAPAPRSPLSAVQTLAPGTPAPSDATDDATRAPTSGDADRELDDDNEEGVEDDDTMEEEVVPEDTDGAAGAWGSKGGAAAAAWGGAVAVGALGAVALGLF